MKTQGAPYARKPSSAIALSYEIEQILGKALGYPWYKDDPATFPNATEEDGVCVGEHTATSLAEVAASVITKLRETGMKYMVFDVYNDEDSRGAETYRKTFDSLEAAMAWCDKLNPLPYSKFQIVAFDGADLITRLIGTTGHGRDYDDWRRIHWVRFNRREGDNK